MRTHIGPGVIQALNLDDSALLREAYPELAFGRGRGGGLSVTGEAAAMRKLADDIAYASTSEWDLPFWLKGACARTASRLRKELARG